MSEYKKQAAFLKALMLYDTSMGNQDLLQRLAEAERNERCLIAACWLVGVIAMFGLAGLGYSAVLLPQFFDSSTHMLIRFFGALGLGSSLCLLFFLGLWFWYRNAVNRIHEQCRAVIKRMLELRLGAHLPKLATLPSSELPDLKVLPPPQPDLAGHLLKLPKAS